VAAVGCKTLTGGARLSARAGDAGLRRLLGRAGPKGKQAGLLRRFGFLFFFFLFLFQIQILFPNQINYKQTPNSNRDLNPATKNNAPACMQQ
jgi:hypothetical protein